MSSGGQDREHAKRPPRLVGWRLMVASPLAGLGVCVLGVAAGVLVAEHRPGANRAASSRTTLATGADGRAALVRRFPGWGMTRVELVDVSGPEALGEAAGVHADGDRMPASALPGDVLERWPDRFGESVAVMRYGVPLRCASWYVFGLDDSRAEMPTLGLRRLTVGGRAYHLPTRILVSGLVGNIVALGGGVLGLAAAIRWLRRCHRRRRNRCVACGYDMAGGAGVCPECGTLDAGRAG